MQAQLSRLVYPLVKGGRRGAAARGDFPAAGVQSSSYCQAHTLNVFRRIPACKATTMIGTTRQDLNKWGICLAGKNPPAGLRPVGPL